MCICGYSSITCIYIYIYIYRTEVHSRYYVVWAGMYICTYMLKDASRLPTSAYRKLIYVYMRIVVYKDERSGICVYDYNVVYIYMLTHNCVTMYIWGVPTHVAYTTDGLTWIVRVHVFAFLAVLLTDALFSCINMPRKKKSPKRKAETPQSVALTETRGHRRGRAIRGPVRRGTPGGISPVRRITVAEPGRSR